MAYALPPANELRNRGTFAFHRRTTSQFSYPVRNTRPAARLDAAGNVVSDTYLAAGASASIAQRDNCVIVPDLTLSLSIQVRQGVIITGADVTAVIDRIRAGYTTLDAFDVPGLDVLLGL